MVGFIVVYPLLWTVCAMLRGPLVFSDVRQTYGWYPYPFIDPANGGYGSVAVFVVLIGASIAGAGAAVIAVSRGSAADEQRARAHSTVVGSSGYCSWYKPQLSAQYLWRSVPSPRDARVNIFRRWG